MTEQMAELLKVSLGLWNLKNMEQLLLVDFPPLIKCEQQPETINLTFELPAYFMGDLVKTGPFSNVQIFVVSY